uniref:Protein kinase domain-containing protein n=1 Tax=Oryza brachyantha TaxID=4533 RepID=J3LQ16_ORYBR
EHPGAVRGEGRELPAGVRATGASGGDQGLQPAAQDRRGRLREHLFNKAYPVLPWDIRLEIALGAAEGLLYLHEGLEVQVWNWIQ